MEARQRPLLKRRTKEALTCYLFLAPNMALFVTFFLYAIVSAFYNSMTDWDFINPTKNFIGLQNYIELFGDRYFHIAMKNTLWVTAAVPIGLALSLGIALIMNSKLVKFKTLFRTGFYTPVVISMVVWALIWRGIYSIDGLLNEVLAFVGLPVVDWLGNLKFALPAVIAMGTIKGLGYNMVLFLAGLQTIPPHLYEAAEIDGANSWQQFWHVTLPGLQHTTFFISVTAIIGSFQVFDQIYVMTGGGPLGRTEVLVSYLYYKGFLSWEMGYANAIGVVIFMCVLIMTLIQRKLIPSGTEY